MSREKLIKRIQMRILPPSSRSYQSGLSELRGKLDCVNRDNQQLQQRLNEILTRNVELMESVCALQKQVAALADSEKAAKEEILHNVRVSRKHMQLYAESIFRKKDESIRASRIRFFSQLPEACGTIRLHQKVNAKIMDILDRICRDNNLQYWFGYASLLGAYTRKGSIPWDDDVDICMMRDDLETLKRILKNNTEYQITTVYDYGVKVIQYRFCLRDPQILCFIDIGVWDWAKKVDRESECMLKTLRCDLMEEIEKSCEFEYWRERNYLFAPDSGYVVQWSDVDYESQNRQLAEKESHKIESLFQKYRKKAYDLGILCDKNEATAVSYGMDNILESLKRPMLYDLNSIFPTQRVDYEESSVECPAEIEVFLDACYTEWPYLPQDILGGHDHFEKKKMEEQTIQLAMKEFLKEKGV